MERQMVEAVNSERIARGLPPYTVDDRLVRLARDHSEDMVRRGYFSHTTPEGVTLRDRLARAGIEVHWAGENIQRNSSVGAEAVANAMEWFMQSTPHRNNILHQHYTHIGVGVVWDDDAHMTTFTLVFARLEP
ncbi:MAG: CAP domain-containing protein [Chloroflexi bacterium]|nr:MAG: CAP domain-containing protein [Chloroflexota bacterium]